MAHLFQMFDDGDGDSANPHDAADALYILRDGSGPIYVVPEHSTFGSPDDNDQDPFVVADGPGTLASNGLTFIVETFDGDLIGAFPDPVHALAFAVAMADACDAENTMHPS